MSVDLRVREFSWYDLDRMYQITMNTFPRDIERIGFNKKTFKQKFVPFHMDKWVQKISRQVYSKVYVGEIDKEVVAITTIKRMNSAWYLSGVMVDTEYRGRGYGRKIVVNACTNAYSLGAERIILHVPEKNLAAKALYKSLGFEQFERVVRYVKDTGKMKVAFPDGVNLVRIDMFNFEALEIIDKCRTPQSVKVYKSELPPWHMRVLLRGFQTEIVEEYALTHNGTWIGICIFRTERGKKGEGFVTIHVVPEYRGNGIEKALLTWSMDKAFTLGLHQVAVQVDEAHSELVGACETLQFIPKQALEGMVKFC
jgi:ribosomal protein S18 acetylase RimI-like enzyme